MKINVQKLVFILLFFFVSVGSYAQTTFTQTYVDRCTGNVQVVTANFVNGSATVAFYNKVRTFTYQEFLNGQLQSWLTETYVWWNSLSPCSTSTTQAQQAQQAAQNATSAATTASSAATSAVNSTSQTNTNNGTTNTNTTNTTSNQETTNTSGGSTESSGGETTGETKTEETKTEETKTEESTEEKSSEESSDDGDGEEGGDEKEDSDDNGDGEESEEEVKEKKKKQMLPIQLRADMMSNQSLVGGYDLVTSIGMTQSSLFGDETYGLTGMIWSNLRQFSLNGSYTKVHMEKFDLSTITHDGHTHYSKTKDVDVNNPKTPPIPKVTSVTSLSVGYMNNFGSGAIILSASKLKPMGRWGTAGVGVTVTNLYYESAYQQTMVGYNVLYTNVINVSPRVQYSPALIWTQTPYSSRIGRTKQPDDFRKTFNYRNELSGTEIGGIAILSNSFTIRLTRRFTFNTGWTLIKFTDPSIPIINSFMIGAKLPF